MTWTRAAIRDQHYRLGTTELRHPTTSFNPKSGLYSSQDLRQPHIDRPLSEDLIIIESHDVAASVNLPLMTSTNSICFAGCVVRPSRLLQGYLVGDENHLLIFDGACDDAGFAGLAADCSRWMLDVRYKRS